MSDDANPPSARARLTVQTLGEHTYALPDMAPPPSPTFLATMKMALIMLPLGTIQLFGMALVMSVSPKFVRDRILGGFWPPIMEGIACATQNQRKLLLQNVQGRVLDVGSGGGAYLRNLSGKKVSRVVCLEPVKSMHPTIQEAATRAGLEPRQVSIIGEGLETFANNRASNKERFDWIILGNVLCEVPNPRLALEKVNDMLVPGGHVYFMEHVCSPPTAMMARFMDKLLAPVWKTRSGGCNCNRDTMHMMDEAMSDRWDIVRWELKHFKGPFNNHWYMGLARKTVAGEA